MLARSRRSPAMSWYRNPTARTRIGCSMPCWRKRIGERGDLVGVELPSRLERIGIDLIDGDLDQLGWPPTNRLRNPLLRDPSSASRPRPRRRLFMVNDLHDKFGISPRASCSGGVVQNAQTVARRLTDRYIPRDQRLEDGFREVLTHFIDHFVGKLQRRVEHCQDDPANFEPVVVLGLGLPGQLDDLRKPLHREVFALDRDVNLRRGSQCGTGQEAQRRGAIDEDIVEAAELSGQLLAECRGALAVGGRKRVGVGQALGARQYKQPGCEVSTTDSARG